MRDTAPAQDWDGSLVPQGLRRSVADVRRPPAPRPCPARTGIRRVTGFVIGDASCFDSRDGAPGWKPSFAGLESPPLSALVVDRRLERPRAGAQPAARRRRALRPAAARRTASRRARPRVGTAPANAILLATDLLRAAREIIEFMDHYSDNFTAEMLLKAIGAEVTGVGSAAAGARIVTRELARGRRAAHRRPDRRRLGALALGPRHRARARRAARRDLARAEHARDRARRAAGRRRERHTRLPHDIGRRPRHRPRQDGDDRHRLGALGLRRPERYAFVTIENGYPVDWTAAHEAQDRFARRSRASTSPG